MVPWILAKKEQNNSRISKNFQERKIFGHCQLKKCISNMEGVDLTIAVYIDFIFVYLSLMMMKYYRFHG